MAPKVDRRSSRATTTAATLAAPARQRPSARPSRTSRRSSSTTRAPTTASAVFEALPGATRRFRAIINNTKQRVRVQAVEPGRPPPARGEYVWLARKRRPVADPRFLEVLVQLLDAQTRPARARVLQVASPSTKQALCSRRWTRWTRPLDPQRWDRDFTNSGREECRRYLSHRKHDPEREWPCFIRKKRVRARWVRPTRTMADARRLGEFGVRILLASDVALQAHKPLNLYRHTHDQSVRADDAEGAGSPQALPADREADPAARPRWPAEAWARRPSTRPAWYWGAATPLTRRGFGDRAVHLDGAARRAGRLDPELAWAITAGIAAPGGGRRSTSTANLHTFSRPPTCTRAATDPVPHAFRRRGARPARLLEGRLAAAEATIDELGRQMRFLEPRSAG